MRRALMVSALVLVSACTGEETSSRTAPEATPLVTEQSDAKRPEPAELRPVVEAAEVLAKQRRAALRQLAQDAFKHALATQSGRMTVSPTTARPGEVVSLMFSTGLARTAALSMARTDDGQGEVAYYLTSDVLGTEPAWSTPAEFNPMAFDVIVGGRGPDHIVVPEVAEPGEYRLCVNVEDCVTLTVV